MQCCSEHKQRPAKSCSFFFPSRTNSSRTHCPTLHNITYMLFGTHNNNSHVLDLCCHYHICGPFPAKYCGSILKISYLTLSAGTERKEFTGMLFHAPVVPDYGNSIACIFFDPYKDRENRPTKRLTLLIPSMENLQKHSQSIILALTVPSCTRSVKTSLVILQKSTNG